MGTEPRARVTARCCVHSASAMSSGSRSSPAVDVGACCACIEAMRDSVSTTQRLPWCGASAPHLATGLRNGIALFATAPDASVGAGPGIIVLAPDLSVISINPQAEHWLAELDDADWPHAPRTAAPDLRGGRPGDGRASTATRARPNATRLRRAARRLDHGTRVAAQRNGRTSDRGRSSTRPTASQLSSLILAAHGLTAAQSRVAALVLQGRSTRHIVTELHISSNTVQEHLRAVFDKFGIGSRRELVAALSGRPR